MTFLTILACCAGLGVDQGGWTMVLRVSGNEGDSHTVIDGIDRPHCGSRTPWARVDSWYEEAIAKLAKRPT
jgi:hypothetical protein